MKSNYSLVTEFIIIGLSSRPEMQTFLFIIFLIIYAVTLIGNSIILFLSSTDPSLNTPMYFFLGFLSFLDIWCTSASIPKMLSGCLTQSNVISYNGCAAQQLFITWPLGTELLLLTVMAYDRYIAIVNPLHYGSVINRRVCINIAVVITFLGLLNASAQTYCTFRLPFCNDNKVNHFFCEVMPLIKLACGDTTINEIVVFTADFLYGICCFLLTSISYALIFNVVLKIRSSEGKRKAFSTCTSHIIIVCIYYGAVIFTYIRPKSNLSLEKDKIISSLYAVITPTLNPIIYSLRNKEVKEAFQRAVKKISNIYLA